MRILGLLQNQWFKDPVRAQAIYDRHAGDLDRQAELNGAYLFYGSLTGKRLTTALGDELCDRVIWWEASPKKAGVSSGAFPADLPHVRAAIDHFKPTVVVAFGNIAVDAVRHIFYSLAIEGSPPSAQVHYAPHPAARGGDVVKRLNDLGETLRGLAQAGGVAC